MCVHKVNCSHVNDSPFAVTGPVPLGSWLPWSLSLPGSGVPGAGVSSGCGGGVRLLPAGFEGRGITEGVRAPALFCSAVGENKNELR